MYSVFVHHALVEFATLPIPYNNIDIYIHAKYEFL